MTTFHYSNIRVLFRLFLASIVLVGIVAYEKPANSSEKKKDTSALSLTVYKDPSCKCCKRWISHMKDAGFQISVRQPSDLNAIKDRYGIKKKYQSCHTAVRESSGAVFEGHIPASVVKRFLKEKPAGAKGLSAPGMPMGSPGMKMGNRRDPYDVLLLMEDGSSSIYEHINGKRF